MNSLGERPHSTVGNAIRSILHSAGLNLKFWNFALYHFIRLYNFFPHGSHSKSPFEQIYGYKPDLSLLRVFGCNVYIRPPGRRSSKLDTHVIKGKFLGYTSTLKQIYYLEVDTNKIKIATHARFDEGLATVPLVDLPPYALQLRKALGHSLPADKDVISTPDDLDLLACLDRFPVTFNHRFQIKLTDIANEYDTLGFILKEDSSLQRCFVADIQPWSTACSQFTRWRSRLICMIILAVGDTIVSTKPETEAALSRYLVDLANSSDPIYVSITFAHDRALIQADLNPEDPSPIQMDQIYHISQIYKTGEEIQYQPRLDTAWFQYFDNLVNQLSESADEYVQKTTSSQFTRKQLMKREDFNLWLEAEYKQLDTHENDGMFGKPCPRPQNAIVLRSIWSYMVKWDGTRKARNCGDGRPLRDAHYRRLEAVYTACISQVGVKIFFCSVGCIELCDI
jgi:hypothetical protein